MATCPRPKEDKCRQNSSIDWEELIKPLPLIKEFWQSLDSEGEETLFSGGVAVVRLPYGLLHTHAFMGSIK